MMNAKAFNSIGKFHRDGIGVEKNPLKAIQYFREATERGDIYSILNEAYIHAEKEESFKLAIECYEKAIEQNTSLSYLKFGEFIEKNVEYFSKNKYKYDILKVFDYYLTAIKLSNGPVAARVYYNIGCMLSSDASLIVSKSKEIQKLFGSEQRDIVNLAFQKSKTIFENSIRRNVVLSHTDKEVYNNLKNRT